MLLSYDSAGAFKMLCQHPPAHPGLSALPPAK